MERGLARDRHRHLALVHRRGVVTAAASVEQPARRAEQRFQRLGRKRAQVADGAEIHRAQRLRVRVADARELLDRPRGQELLGLGGDDPREAVGLHRLAGELRQHPIRPQAAGHGEAGRLEDLALQPRRLIDGIAVQSRGAAEVAIGFVEIGLDRRGERAAAAEDFFREAAIDLRVPFEDHGGGAASLRFRKRHAGSEPEAPGLVRARGDHAGADDHRLAGEARIEPLFDRHEERIDVDVKDDALVRERAGRRGARCRRCARCRMPGETLPRAGESGRVRHPRRSGAGTRSATGLFSLRFVSHRGACRRRGRCLGIRPGGTSRVVRFVRRRGGKRRHQSSTITASSHHRRSPL